MLLSLNAIVMGINLFRPGQICKSLEYFQFFTKFMGNWFSYECHIFMFALQGCDKCREQYHPLGKSKEQKNRKDPRK